MPKKLNLHFGLKYSNVREACNEGSWRYDVPGVAEAWILRTQCRTGNTQTFKQTCNTRLLCPESHRLCCQFDTCARFFAVTLFAWVLRGFDEFLYRLFSSLLVKPFDDLPQRQEAARRGRRHRDSIPLGFAPAACKPMKLGCLDLGVHRSQDGLREWAEALTCALSRSGSSLILTPARHAL